MRVITVFLMLMMSMVTMASQLNDTIIVVQDSAKIAKEEEAKKKVHQYRYRVEHLMLSDLLDRFNNRKIVVDAFVDFDWMKENLEKMDSTFVFEWDKMSYEIRKKGKFIFIIYKFPKPNCMPEALYGIIAINKKTCFARYFTLEKTFSFTNDAENHFVCEWAGFGKHLNYGVTINELEPFYSWVVKTSKKKNKRGAASMQFF